MKDCTDEAVCLPLHHSRKSIFCDCPTLRDASFDLLVKVTPAGSCIIDGPSPSPLPSFVG